MTNVPKYFDLFIGKMGGSAGEIAAFALIIGLIYLLARKIITFHIPLSIILAVTVFSGILWWSDPTKYADPLFHLLTGGLLLGAFFMATDYVTSPMTHGGMWIYGIGIGTITILIRVFGAYPEGVQFAILIMNAFVPLINKYIKPARFGERPKHE
jgi:electron transport complex protein RnfD